MLGTVSPAPSFTTARHRELKKLSKVQDEVAQANFSEKRYVWVPDPKKGYELGYIVRDEANDDAVVSINGGEEFVAHITDLEKVNPPKFDRVEDMADLGYLNEASVVHNLKLRYFDNLIYTYSGLFLVAVNPYYNLPIYTDEILRSYRGKKRGEIPPHIFSISDAAYQSLLTHRENQSILITGESGAGKTENTKKVIQYLTGIASERSRAKSPATTPGNTLEQQILRANPILEAFGNAKTVRNHNSSRFGKFIRIAFNDSGYIAGANIDWYLFEKSRVTHQSGKERNYHIFYQFLRGAPRDLRDQLLLDGGLDDYTYTRASLKHIDGVDDARDFKLLTESLGVMNFNADHQLQLFRVLAAVLHLGNIALSAARDDQAMLADPATAERVCHVLGVPPAEFTKGLLRPRMRAGRDWVTQARTVAQVTYSLEALARVLYERMFGRLIDRINATIDRPAGKCGFIGVLDIAGFEIFESNSFEQLCINYTNERLQQFFNHHMFVLEQEEYQREGIDWQFIDFGLDLQPTIDLIEKTNPIGILSCLDEECVMPKATDKTFTEKLHGLWKGRSSQYEAPRFRQGFIVQHYASQVEYSTEGWLDKNKDPLSENLTRLLAHSTEPGIAQLFADFKEEAGGVGSTRGSNHNRPKRGAFRTVGQRHKEQLNSLMKQLYATEPHFVRCIIPNEQKLPKVINTPLVLEQLRCNGVLEGIRICRQGFPNRLPFPEFRQRYEILAPNAIGARFVDSKQAAELLLAALSMDPALFRVGRSKVFFRAGVLPELEEIRDVKLSQIISHFQAYSRGFLARRQFRRRLDQAKAIRMIQRNARGYLQLREWPWWNLFSKVKPLLQITPMDEELRAKEAAVKQLEAKLAEHVTEREALQTTHDDLVLEKRKVEEALASERNLALDQEEILQRTQEREQALGEELGELKAELARLEATCAELAEAKSLAETRLQDLAAKLTDEAATLERLDQERQQRDERLTAAQAELETVRAEAEALREAAGDTELRLAQATEALDAGEARQLELEKQAGQLQAAAARAAEELQASADEHRQLSEARAAAEAALAQARADLQALESSKGETETSVAQLETELAMRTEAKEALDKQCRDLTVKVASLGEELSAERSERERLTQQRTKLEGELAEVRRLATAKMDAETTQTELARQREEELSGVRADLTAAQAELEKTRRRQVATTETLNTQLQDAQHAAKRLGEEKGTLTAAAENHKARANQLAARVKELETATTRLTNDLASHQSRIADFEKERIQLTTVRETLEAQLAQLQSQYTQLDTDYGESDTARLTAERELETLREEMTATERQRATAESTRDRAAADLDDLRRRLDEQDTARRDLAERCSQQAAELEELREAHHQESLTRSAAHDETRARLEADLLAATTKVEELGRQQATTEKARARLTTEVEDLKHELEREHALVRTADKASQQLEVQLRDLHAQVDTERQAKDRAETESRRLQTALEAERKTATETTAQLAAVQRGKADLERELQGLIDQVGDGAKNVHELERAQRQLAADVETITRERDAAREATARAEEAQQLAANEFATYRQTMEAQLAAKDDENEEGRRLLLKEVNALGERLDEELAAKLDLIKVKQRLEADYADLAASVDTTNRSQDDLEAARARAEAELRETKSHLEAERRARRDLEELAARHEKKSSGLQSQLERLETHLDTQDRQKRLMEKRLGEVTVEAAAHLESRNALQDSLSKTRAELADVRRQLASAAEARNSLEKARALGDTELEHLKTTVRQEMADRLEQLEESRRALMAALRLAQTENEDRGHALAGAEAARRDLQTEVSELQARLETELQATADRDAAVQRATAEAQEANLRYQTEAARATDLAESLATYRRRLDETMVQLETAEVEKLRAAKAEAQGRTTVQEWQDVVNKVKEDRAAAEGQARQLEERLLHCQAKMDDDALAIADLTHVRQRLQEEVETATEQHAAELAEHDATMDAMRTKYQKELETLTAELERETAARAELRERCQSTAQHAADLAQRLETETKAAQAFQREKERLEDKWTQLQGGYTETRASATAVRARADALTDQVRELTGQLEATAAERDVADKSRRQLEQRLEASEAQAVEATRRVQALEKATSAVETEAKRLRDQLEEERDISETAISKLNKVEEQLRDHQEELRRERVTTTELTKAKLQLEKQAKHLNLRLVDLETGSMADTMRGGSRRQSQLLSPPAKLARQLDSEAKEKHESLRQARGMERTIRELQFQLSEREKLKGRQDEELQRLDQKVQRMRKHIEELEVVENDLQLSKRRCEREAEEQREHAQRLERELERIKARFA